ncbi:DUF5011 domain-containing protein [Butyrivibrio fibrisolvens]|uniref:DUF5011 domain-containing protein n=1 Tax=Butyrivibrio fibrisolvens TaxID=831 RepID=UPI0020BEE4A8|nr:DUF5011 domain-containing protein [Butyrivibrio fibrisolvens]
MRKKFVAMLMTLTCTVSVAACSNGAASGGDNTAPVIEGAADATVMAGTEFDALSGITASDDQDGDLSSVIKVEATPSLDFKNDKATPENAGSYELVYSVTDKGGLTTESYATLTVTKMTGDEEVYKEFDFSKAGEVDNKGWEVKIGDNAKATGQLKQGAYVFDIENPGESDGEVALSKSGFEVKKADYTVKVWAKSTKPTYAHIIARDESAADWATFGGSYNVQITEEVAPYELTFSSDKEGKCELMINMGKITPNPDNAEDTTPEDFTVTIDKIEIYESVGEEELVASYTAEPSKDNLVVEAGDSAEAAVTFEDGSAKTDITAYPSADGGVWSIKTDIAIGDVKIENGKKYYYRFNVNAANGQTGEVLVESREKGFECRANFNTLDAPAGEEITVEGVFTAEADVEDPVIRLQIGNAPEGVTDNEIVISSIEFGTVEGDKEVTKTIDSFMAFGRNSANADNTDLPWETFNGTDEDNDKGVGVIWAEDGNFFYRIDNGGTVDWHNKLICGYTGNPLTLESDAYYTIEITVKAQKPVSCGVFLNPMGDWDPRISEGMDITTEYQTFRFTTTDTFITDMDFELLFQFGSEDTAAMGENTIEFSNITIYKMSAM